MAQTQVVATQDKVFYTTFAFTASAPVGTIVSGTMYPYGYDDSTTSTAYQVPSGSVLNLVDVFITSAQTPDGQLIFKINGVKQGENFVISGLNATNSGRTKLSQPLVLRPGDVFVVQEVNTVANSTTAATVAVNLHFLQVPG